MTLLVDTHAHLEMGEFEEDREDTLRRAAEAGLRAIVTVGTTEEGCFKAIDLASRHEEIYAAVGIHPHNAKEIKDGTYGLLRKLAGQNKVVAWGEIGLDFFHNHSPRSLQLQVFGEQLELACEAGLPVIIHDREAHREVLEMLVPWRGRLKGVFHCFSGDRQMARKCLDLGYYLSVTGALTYPKADTLKEVVRYLPLDALLVETDCPYLAPQPWRGRRNEPAYVAQTARAVAEIRGITLDSVGEATSRNAAAIMNLALPPSKPGG